MGCAVALIATSAWLISRSAQRPRESALAVAVVGVQFFALGSRRTNFTQSQQASKVGIVAPPLPMLDGPFRRVEHPGQGFLA